MWLVGPPYVSGDKEGFSYLRQDRHRDKLRHLYLPSKYLSTYSTYGFRRSYIHMYHSWGQRNITDYDDHSFATKHFHQQNVSDSTSTQNSGQRRCWQNFSDILEGCFTNDRYVAGTEITAKIQIGHPGFEAEGSKTPSCC